MMKDKDRKSEKREATKTDDCIFSTENVNMGRQPEIDYYKTVLIIIMVIDHIYENYSRDSLAFWIESIGFLYGASGFMILMGIGMRYSRHQELSYFISRGILLLTKAQIVNLLRYALPNIIAWRTTGNKLFISRALVFFQPDILTFASFSFFFFIILKKNKLSDTNILILGIIMNNVGFLLFKIINPPNSFLLKQMLGFFILTYTETYFPFFSYFMFVAFGYWIGGIYQKISNKDKFYNLILVFFTPIVIIYYYLRINYSFLSLPDINSDEVYCLMPGPDGIAECMNTLIFFGIYYKINKIFGGKTPYLVKDTSINLNKYYMIHYILELQLTTFLRATKGDAFPSKTKYPTLLGLMFFVITRIIIDINDRYMHITITNLKKSTKIILFPLIWITSIISLIYIYPKVETYTTFFNNYLYGV